MGGGEGSGVGGVGGGGEVEARGTGGGVEQREQVQQERKKKTPSKNLWSAVLQRLRGGQLEAGGVHAGRSTGEMSRGLTRNKGGEANKRILRVTDGSEEEEEEERKEEKSWTTY